MDTRARKECVGPLGEVESGARESLRLGVRLVVVLSPLRQSVSDQHMNEQHAKAVFGLRQSRSRVNLIYKFIIVVANGKASKKNTEKNNSKTRGRTFLSGTLRLPRVPEQIAYTTGVVAQVSKQVVQRVLWQKGHTSQGTPVVVIGDCELRTRATGK